MADFKFTDGRVQERMMRIGIEAKNVVVGDTDTLYKIAVATLKDDDRRNAVVGKIPQFRLQSLDDIERLFHKQVGGANVIRYYMARNAVGGLEIFSITDTSVLLDRFKYGELQHGVPTFSNVAGS